METEVRTLTEKRFFKWCEDDKSVTLRSRSGSYGGGSEVFIIHRYHRNSVCDGLEMGSARTSDAREADHMRDGQKIMKTWCIGGGQAHDAYCPDYEKSKTLNCMCDPMKILEKGENMNTVVRRLTPMECERLQGFPDGWTDIGEWTDSNGKKHQTTDSARYKALGNSIAVGYANEQSGFWMLLMKRISAQYERRATLGSLFDGIGGFPLAWETYNGKGSALWASEIEEFPIAVTKKRFPEEERRSE